MLRRVLYIFLALGLSGCGGAVEDFVRGGEPAPPVTPPVITDAEHEPFKLSPGAVVSVGGAVAMKARITTSRHVMTGGAIGATVGLHRNARQ